MNEYGLDANYFAQKLKLMLRDISRYTPAEMARELARMSVTADKSVLGEDELLAIESKAVPDGWKLVPIEPTQEMLDEIDVPYKYSREMWNDILAAVPETINVIQRPSPK